MAADFLSRAAGIDLTSFRESHVAARIDRAIQQEQAVDVLRLARLLGTDDAARNRFRRSVAVSVTGPFRDPAQFELLEHVLLPPLLARPGRLGIWSAGCSNGAELYSVASLLDRAGALERSFLLGSDLLEENIALARVGDYDGAPVDSRLRAATRWERRDLVADGPPARHWQLILCRNVAIYLSPAAKAQLHETLARALAKDGILLFGRSERLARPADLGLELVAPHAYRRAA